MNAAHIHLLVNHVPVLGAAFSTILLIIALLLQNPQFQKVALVFLALVALSAVAAFVSGDEAADMIGPLRLPGVTDAAIHAHDEAAGTAFVFMCVTGGAGLAGLLVFRRAPVLPRWFTTGILALCLVAMFLLFRTAWLGGQIRHTEIAGSSAVSAAVEHGKND